MDANMFALLVASLLVVAAACVREVRVAVNRRIKQAFEAGRHSGAQALRALDLLLAQPDQPTKSVVLERPSGDIVLTIRSVTDGEMKFLQRTPAGMQTWELVSMALVQPDMTANELRRVMMPDEIAKLADVILSFSGYSDVPA